MAKSTKSAKPSKPYPDFPLTAHATGRWCKRINGKLHYFGRWGRKRGGKSGSVVNVDNFEEAARQAVDLYNEQRDDLYAGRTPRAKSDSVTLAELCNRFLGAKRKRVDTGELKVRTWQEYRGACVKILDAFGRDRPVDDVAVEDFDKLRTKLSRGPKGKRSLVSLAKDVRLVRIVFKYAFDAALIEQPVRFGPDFKQPEKRVIRQARQASGKRMFEAEELQVILDNARQPLRAMILLGLNCAFGQTDIANLPQSAVDLEGGWLDYPRPKTAVERRIPLWPETVAAMREAIAVRPRAKNAADDGLCFLTTNGNRWVRNSDSERESWVDSVGLEFKKILGRLDINGRRNFYAIRHTFETIAGESKDQVAVDAVMGHADQSMAANYRERISDDRLRAVVETVRQWLWPAV